MSKNEQITSREKAAILIQVLDEDTAAEVVTRLNEDEKETLLREISRFKKYPTDTLQDVLGQFMQEMSIRELSMMAPNRNYIRRLFKNMSDEEWEALIQDMSLNPDNPFDFLNSVTDLESLLTILNDESPQTIAIIASHIKPQLASRLIEKLPEQKMVETVMRIAKLEQVDGDLVNQIGELLKSKLKHMSFGPTNKTDGLKTIVNILNNVSRGVEKIVFEKLDVEDYALSEKIRENMFVFEDILRLDDLALRRVLEEIKDNNLLAKALKSAKEELKEKLFTCISASRKQMIVDEMDGLGPLKVADVEKAQQVVTSTVKRLEKDGKIVVQRGEEDVII
ncbi:flagellar motor switch protein FliG [Ectobacillus sp. JY-23]|uniref:flagellar motor switch protein FliG n=1 Tax=Ectobacillus sp. JY-23 TaxID=2933872 RepID=UPI001FF5DF9C|nr:flagellar motor switch protein FliG [Ectobacillus sp. JY-23]UOY93384.1 flagellar motor switch protein FliG [Ectobacillus sp. JY-23]